MYLSLFGMAKVFLLVSIFLGSIQCVRITKKRKLKSANNSICSCELQMTHGWNTELLLSIFKRPLAPWGPGKSHCSRMREGCKILCNIMGRRYLEGREVNSQSQGTRLGQRLCELHSYRNGYKAINPPGQIVSVNYKLDKCWKQNVGYAVAFKVDGNLCCRPVAPFKAYPFVRLYVWNKNCMDNETHLYGRRDKS